jgi:hypothetical protein
MADEKQDHFDKLFPVAFYDDLHPDFGINFQVDRCYNFSNDDNVEMVPAPNRDGQYFFALLYL